MNYCTVKRAMDILLSLIGLVLMVPLFLVLILLVRIDSPGPIFFRQKRVGKNKTHFDILKFRTMRIETPKDMAAHLLTHPEQYYTRMGGFLRRTSLDELPQIWNILVGEMSIVGPRPALWNQYDLVAERDRYNANGVLPGLTGWAQIHGRNELTIAEKAKLDGEYAEKMGFRMDVTCFMGTFLAVLRRDVIRRQGPDTREEEVFKVKGTDANQGKG